KTADVILGLLPVVGQLDGAVTLLTGRTMAGTEVGGAERGLAIGSIIPAGKMIGGIAGDILSAVKPTTATVLNIADDANRAWDGVWAISWNPLTGPGPLGKEIASTFRSFTYTEHVLQESTILYRVYSDPSKAIGPYWTRTAPSGPVQSIMDSALNPIWGKKRPV
ncbi:MAG: hypothetical protein NZM04_05310, partial [Methylacidiphilales bacterium]|nr:hypothetical protein [Candidatus Methylacidiphilales bacterium]